MAMPPLGTYTDLSNPANRPSAPKRQCCRKCLHSVIPEVTLTFDGGARRLHWCFECADDADRYYPQSDDRVRDEAERLRDL